MVLFGLNAAVMMFTPVKLYHFLQSVTYFLNGAWLLEREQQRGPEREKPQ